MKTARKIEAAEYSHLLKPRPETAHGYQGRIETAILAINVLLLAIKKNMKP